MSQAWEQRLRKVQGLAQSHRANSHQHGLFPGNHPEQTSRRPESQTGSLPSFEVFLQECPMAAVCIPNLSELRFLRECKVKAGIPKLHKSLTYGTSSFFSCHNPSSLIFDSSDRVLSKHLLKHFK